MRVEARGEAGAALREQIRRMRMGPERERASVDLTPGSAYEAVTRQMVEGLAEDLKEIKGRLNGLLWMVAGAIVLDVVIRVAGVG